MTRLKTEPLLWMLFSAGGVMAALLIPILLVLFGLAFPLGWLSPPDHAHLLSTLGHPLTRMVLSSHRSTVFQATRLTREIADLFTPSTLRATTWSKVLRRC